MKLLPITNYGKGGIGKTTTTKNLTPGLMEQLNRFLNEIQETARDICNAIDSELQALSENQTEEQTEDECLGLAM